MASVDALVMGRNTFDVVRGFDAWPYGAKPVVVLSRTLRALRAPPGANVELMSGEPRDVAARLTARGLRGMHVDGGQVVTGFLQAGLVGRLIITRIPVLIGRGIPLFGTLTRDLRFEHVRTRTFRNGMVQGECRAAPGVTAPGDGRAPRHDQECSRAPRAEPGPMAPLAAALLALGLALPLALPLAGVTPPLAIADAMLVGAPAAGALLGSAQRRSFARLRRPVRLAARVVALGVAACVAGAVALVGARDAAGFLLIAGGLAGLGWLAGAAGATRPSRRTPHGPHGQRAQTL